MRTRSRLPALLPILLLLASAPVLASGPEPREEAPTDVPATASHRPTADPAPQAAHDGAVFRADTEHPVVGDGPRPRVDIRRRSGLAPPDDDAMRAWHRRYRAAARPVKAALVDLLAARRRLPPSRLGPHCRKLGKAMEAFWTDARRNRVLPVADAAVDLHLKRLYLRIGEVAESCEAGRWAETAENLRQAGLAYRQAELAMGRWEVEP